MYKTVIHGDERGKKRVSDKIIKVTETYKIIML